MQCSNTYTPSNLKRTAVLFIVFNRLETTKTVFEAIRQAKPPRLYIASDGARRNREEEIEKVLAVRKYISESIDWSCEVQYLIREENLGCKDAVSGAISWFFEHEEEGIILEDDCLPSQSFFTFAEEALSKFREHDNIYGITGDYRGSINSEIAQNISLISFPLIWGWATWRRVWKHYDSTMKGWDGDINTIPRLRNEAKETKRYFKKAFNDTASGKINTWDYQFAYQILKNNGHFVTPNLNMISNIGYGNDSTHPEKFNPLNNALPVNDTIVNLDSFVENNYDEWLCKHAFNRKTYQVRAINKLAKILINKPLIK